MLIEAFFTLSVSLSLFFCHAIWYFCEVPVSRIMYKVLSSYFEKHSELLPS